MSVIPSPTPPTAGAAKSATNGETNPDADAALVADSDTTPAARAARRAALTLLVSSLLFALMALGAKIATRRLPGSEVALVRFVTGLVVVCALIATGTVRARPQRWGWLIVRGVFGAIAVISYFASIRAVPVSVATLLNQTQPIYTMLFSWALLRERPRRGAIVALALALIGVTVIVGGAAPEAGAHLASALRGARGQLLGILSAITSGVAVTAIRASRRDRGDGVAPETAWSVFLSFSLFGSLVSLPGVVPPFGTWLAPSAAEWALLMAVGAVSTGGQVIMTASLRHLTGVQSGIIAQLVVPLTVVFGVVVLGERMTAAFVVGAILTIAGVLLVIVTAAPARALAPTVARTPAPAPSRFGV